MSTVTIGPYADISILIQSLLLHRLKLLLVLIFAAIRKEIARRSQATSSEMKDRMANAEESLREQNETQRAVSAGRI